MARWFNVNNLDEVRRALADLLKQIEAATSGGSAVDATQTAAIAALDTRLDAVEADVAALDTRLDTAEAALVTLTDINRSYGEIHRAGTITLSGGSQITTSPTKFNGFGAVGEGNTGVTSDHANDKLTALTPGRYEAIFEVSVAEASSAANVTAQIYLNGSPIDAVRAAWCVTATEWNVISLTTIANVNTNDYFEVYLQNDVGSIDVTLDRPMFSIRRIK